MKTFIKLFSFISLLALVGCGASETPITSIPKKEKQYEIIQPQISKAFSEQKYLGTVKANHYAMIHPRREGIVRDILVDTGDQVSVGQTIAYLFPPGVEGQGSSQIAKARATLEAAQESLRNAELVANESVRVAEQKISQVETDLSATGSLDRSDFRRSQLEQAYDQLEQDGTQIYQNIRRVLFGDSLNARSVNSLVGNFNNKLQEQEVFNLYQEVERSKKRLSSIPEVEREFYLNGFLEQLDQLLKESEQLYETADNTTDHSSGEIGSHLSTIQSLQQKILKAQERFDNALLQMDKLSVNLDSTVQNLDLTKSQAQNSIENAQNQVEVASAAYQATLVQNGHVSVTSPFSGTITSRLVEVGHMVRPMDEMFEIVEVNTSLSQTAQKVVHFGIPAEDRIKISEGQSVNIHWPQTGFSALGTVVRMSRAVDGQARNLMVQAEIKDSEKEFPHNTRVFVTYESEEPSVLRVPSYSLKRRGSDYFLWVMDESKTPWQISVEVIAEDGEWSDVRGNFSLNDRVISNPSVTLFRESQLRQ